VRREQDPERRIHVFDDSERFGRALARAAGIGAAAVRVHEFPDGESLVRIRPPAGRHALVCRSLHAPNAKLVETVLAADALRRAGAQRVSLVTPYMPYMRQDKVFHPGEAVSQQVVCAWLGDAFDGLLTMEAHLHRVHHLREVFPGRAESIAAAPVIARWLRRGAKRTLLVGPDEESEPWVRAVAETAGLPWVVGSKGRRGDRRVRIRLPALPEAARAVIVDDIASSGATIAEAARALRRGGIASVDAVVVHAIFAAGALARIRRAGVRQIVSCDTIEHATNALTTVNEFAQALGSLER